MNHDDAIHYCLQLARRGGHATGLNPRVGAALVRDGQIIAEAFHAGWGQLHAERVLLNQDIAVQSDDILYINLEPCCHTGKTPACTDAIVQSGIRHVVFGMYDPNPVVAGEGIRTLRRAGVRVLGPVLPEVCRRFNRGFVSILEQGRPYITLKSAQTRSGAYANDDGSKRGITSAEQDTWSHTYLRALHDAVLVGVQTIISDDPHLTTRLVPSGESSGSLNNYRLILDPDLRVPLDAKVVQEPLAERTILVTDNASGGYADVLRQRGVQVWHIPRRDGLLDFSMLWERCVTPTDDFAGISSILVEGGLTTWTAFRVQGFRDEEVVLVGSDN